MKTHLVLTMGTSILTHYRCKGGTGKNPPLSYPPMMPSGRRIDRESFPGPEMFSGEYAKIKPVLQRKENEGAEESTIRSALKKRKLEAGDCRFHIIATDTTPCLFCAAFLGHEVLADAEVEYYVPSGLGEAASDRFSHKGLPNLLAQVAAILDEVEAEKSEAVIVPTGGYKIMVPYLTIASILYKQPAYYIYEGSGELIELPAPPLGIDTAEFRAVMVLLENVIGLTMARAAPYYDALPKGFQRLVHLNEKGAFQYTAFGSRLRDMYLRQTSVSPLRVRAEGNSLVPFLGDHRQTFGEIARLGETVWLGDKAPEMADHAKHHHANLFAYTELLLLPVLKSNPAFLSPDELFLLLGMVYLHDCGHSLCTLPTAAGGDIPLLPTEIRNFHNLLGFIRLHSKAFESALERQGLALSSEMLKAVAWLSVYHRKKMPLLGGVCNGPDGRVFEPLARKTDLFWGGKPVGGERLSLLVALFRIIDGMDKQVARAGDAVEISMRAESILADLPFLHDRARRLESVMRQDMFARAKLIADGFLDGIIAEYGLKESVADADVKSAAAAPCCGCRDANCGFEIRSPDDFTEKTVFQEMETALAAIGARDRLPVAWEYLAARVRLFFQSLQPVYYYSDLLLGMPRVTHLVQGGLRRIVIDYPDNADFAGSREKIAGVWNEIKGWIDGHLPEGAPERQALNARLDAPERIVAGIRDEYCGRKYSEVAAVLREAGVVVEFQYAGVPVTCWREKAL